MFKGLGVKDVSITVRSSLLRFLDTEIKDAFEKELLRSGIKVYKGSVHKKVHREDK